MPAEGRRRWRCFITVHTPTLIIGIVDDDLLRDFAPELFASEHVELRQVTTIAGAMTLLDAHVILVDCFIESRSSDGAQVVAKLRDAGYKGRFVAISADEEFRNRMLMLGYCDAACSKFHPEQLAQVVIDELKAA